MKNAVLWGVTLCGIRPDVSKERVASIISAKNQRSRRYVTANRLFLQEPHGVTCEMIGSAKSGSALLS
jgi:hypothetical protein